VGRQPQRTDRRDPGAAGPGRPPPLARPGLEARGLGGARVLCPGPVRGGDGRGRPGLPPRPRPRARPGIVAAPRVAPAALRRRAAGVARHLLRAGPGLGRLRRLPRSGGRAVGLRPGADRSPAGAAVVAAGPAPGRRVVLGRARRPPAPVAALCGHRGGHRGRASGRSAW
jgi:hypothetical protein